VRRTAIAVLILGVAWVPLADGAVPAGTAGPEADGAPAAPHRTGEWAPGRPVEVGAASAILIDAATGEILYEKEARTRRPPASTTKIMTALVILERGRLQERARVSAEAARVGGARMGLRRGQRVALRDLLPAILLRSANDAAVAAAEHVGRTLDGFLARMNAKAELLGMRDTYFMNPHGLDHPLHYSSAYDLARLARHALGHPTFARLVREREARVKVEGRTRRGRPGVRVVALRTHNKLLGAYEGADGVKTGYTEQAGPSLVASAHRQGKRLIAVLLNDPDRWQDAANLFEYGFRALGVEAKAAPSRPSARRAARLARGARRA
jgi:D-alanyl-D-alanine carboxypeptidase